MEEEEHRGVVLVCSICGFLFAVLGPLSFWILWAVNWRPWRLYSWIYARKWPAYVQGPQLSTLCSFFTLFAWLVVVSPITVLLVWGGILIALLERNIIGLAVIMVGVALLLSFYSIMLWWRTQWQSSKAVAYLLLLAVGLLCAYEFCAVYVTTGASASELNSPSGFFFGVSAISLAINMLFISKILFNGSGFDVDEYVRRLYKFAYSDCVEVAPVSCSPDPPDPSELYMTKSSRVLHLGLLYLCSLMVLVVYSILYGLTSKEARWLGALTSVAVVILDWNLGLCSFRFELLKSRMIALFVAGTSRVFLICFGVHYWYLGHCISYAFVASVLLAAAVSCWLSISNPSVARIDALRSTVIKLREGFRRKGQTSSSNSSDGCGSSVKRSSGSVEAGPHGNATDSMYRSNSQSDCVNWNNVPFDRSNSCQEGQSSDKNIDSGRASLAHRSNSCLSAVAVQDPETAVVSADRHGDPTASLVVCSSSGLESQGCESSGSATASGNQQLLDLNLAAIFQDRLNDPRITSMLKRNGGLGDVELANLLQDKGLDPNFSYMMKDKVMDPRILALLQRSSLDADREHQDDVDVTGTDSDRLDTTIANQISLSEELRRSGLENWLNLSRLMFHQVAGSPIRAFVVFTLIFIIETVTVAVHRPKPIKVINATHEQFEFGFSILLLSPVVCSIMAFIWSLCAEEMTMTSKPRKYGFIAWLLSTCVGLLLSFLSKSSVILGLSLTVPLMVACLSFAIPIWMRNGYRFWIPGGELDSRENIRQAPGKKERALFAISITVFTASVIGLGAIVSAKPLDALGYKGWDADKKSFYSPYATSMYLGWALSSTIAVLATGVIPIVAWFATYRFSPSSAICVGLFATVLVSFCGVSYWGVVNSRQDGVPLKADFLAALLPLLCIPAVFSLFTGMYKWKDDDWKISRGVYLFVGMGVLLLLGAISAVIVTIRPWTVGVACLLVILFLVFAIGVIHYWTSNNFYLTRTQMLLVCSLAFLLALAAFLMGLFQEKPFVGASIGYFSFLFLLTGRALTVLLSPPIVVYSPRVLPVYVYDAHADSAKNVSYAFLILYGIALATEVWGVIASLILNPPFIGAAISAITLVIAFSFAVSRPCLTLKMLEDAVHFLSKDTVVQAMSRSANKTRNAISGTYSAPQRSASSAALLVGDPAITLDRAGNFVLPRADVMKLRDRLRNEEITAGSFFCGVKNCLMIGSPVDVDYRRNMCAHARILALEEAIDTEWVYMWDKFGGYLLLLLGLTAKAEQIQDEVRLRLFLDSIGLSDLSAKEIKKWMPEDRRHFELIQESYIREKEMEEEVLMQRREEEGKGRERRKALLEREERKWKELEISLLSSIPNAGSRDAAAMAAAVRAVGGDSALEDSFARDRVSSIARHIRKAQLARRAEQTGIPDTVCILDDEPRSTGRHCGEIDLCLCESKKVSFSIAVMVQPVSGPVCLFGTEFQKKVCWEILVAGSEQGMEAGQVGLRLVTKGERMTTVAKEWNIGASSIADGRWHLVTVTIDADLGEATSFIDGVYDGYQNALPLPRNNGIWEPGTDIWVGARPPTDLDAFGRSDSEGSDSKMQIMDAFLWGRCLTEDEVAMLHTAICSAEYGLFDLAAEDAWHGSYSARVDDWESEEANFELYDQEDVEWDGQYSSGRKRHARDSVAIDIDSFARRPRKPRFETREEVNQRMLSVERAVREALIAKGERNFTDQEFPPDDRSLFVDPMNPSLKLQVVSEWMRPSDIAKEVSISSQPCLFSGSVNSSDVCQGRLGDCWFLSAVAVLTEMARISEVIITPEYNEEGIYTVRFCIQGEWVAVVVDDWIPCESPGKPAFATSRKQNELWVSILEKAYAKLHGSYEALEGGLVQDALVDLTGGAGEEIDMRSPQAQIDLASGRLWSQLLHFKQEGFLLGAGSPSGSDAHISSSGIVQGHAYSILQVREVDGHKLVQIRNPWANEVEWNGPWSDSSQEWTERMKHKLKHVPQSKNGVFWMSWQDFQIHFRSIYVCRVYPPEMRYSVHGQWRGYSAGGCQDYDSWHQNPQYRLRVTGRDALYPVHVFITLTQGVGFSRKTNGFRNYQSSHDSSMFYIGMRILKTRGCRAAYNIYMHESVGGTDYVNSREISCELVLEPYPKGYTIVPTTIHPGEEAPFVLSVFTKAPIKLEAV
ncbi:calpain-type cysteine protease ADL1 isoform X1 [Oryza sativa Japonica Group]|uniref:Calpain-type cysteine protease ADL1 n=3 Tax=Oryza sativa subsp. japonica TaxID=39947 RepID=DEK1_ORYSJ|nr:calpain-type cysteine protease ADL1 precursor [Oryza sativa Japonica Group]XP_015625426.1 calpain-type cysteine protease ADL1 [Oryza sativa Japonica Group]XP_025878634.1 calpain-type cysteine protease ADL1 [Oryza sativa Japonica Group]Q6ZFZ4.1 RecName: Full=Calpain-type cysteine protease ADL1; AltName: Full=Phytocalpain ADL1; AltName: Full=Protein ADAXIALIZED LEAF1; AltName: Full=Protein DEFECTIVE KERNEL 1; Short=OsDEK1; AltName: Full=Protein SHOOTLESS 3; Flags: Precursor [Oryza sativa Japoni|eukprot:NP_001047890.1 Os02g0709400 [Oryza sativa Japonica Group]